MVNITQTKEQTKMLFVYGGRNHVMTEKYM